MSRIVIDEQRCKGWLLAWLDEAQPLALVMTSANPHGEPLVQGNDEAFGRLAEIADVLLMHDRDIVVRCADWAVRKGRPFVFVDQAADLAAGAGWSLAAPTIGAGLAAASGL